MEKITSLAVNSSSASQEIHRIFWNTKVHKRNHNSPPPVDILTTSKPTSSELIFYLRFPHQNRVQTSPHPIHATCSAYLVLLDSITGIISGVKSTLWRSSLRVTSLVISGDHNYHFIANSLLMAQICRQILLTQ